LHSSTVQETLFYAYTFFEYNGIPTFIGALTNLVEYDCSSTLYFGELRGEIFTNLTLLEYLAIGDNSYNTTIPTEIADLPNLQYLYLHRCDLHGDLEFLPTMKSLQEFWIDKNERIEGTIPTDIGQLSGLGEYMSTRHYNIYTTHPFDFLTHFIRVHVYIFSKLFRFRMLSLRPTAIGIGTASESP
jgi:hypothetical protein